MTPSHPRRSLETFLTNVATVVAFVAFPETIVLAGYAFAWDGLGSCLAWLGLTVYSGWALWALIDSDLKGKSGLGGRFNLSALLATIYFAFFAGATVEFPDSVWAGVGVLVAVTFGVVALEKSRRAEP